MKIQYKVSDTAVIQDEVCFETPFIRVRGLSHPVILRAPFINMFYPFKVSEKTIEFEIDGVKVVFRFSRNLKFSMLIP